MSLFIHLFIYLSYLFIHLIYLFMYLCLCWHIRTYTNTYTHIYTYILTWNYHSNLSSLGMTITYQATAVLSSPQISQLHRWVPGGAIEALQRTKREAMPGEADLDMFRWGRGTWFRSDWKYDSNIVEDYPLVNKKWDLMGFNDVLMGFNRIYEDICWFTLW